MSGLNCVGRVGGGPVSVNTYIVEASNSEVMAPGDVVAAASSPSVVDGCTTIRRTAVNAAHIGVIQGFEDDAPPGVDVGAIRLASTKRRVIVIDDPEAIYETDQDDVGAGIITAAEIGANTQCDLLVAAPSADGTSGFKLDSSETATSGNDMIVLGSVRDAAGTSTKLLVKFNLHASNRA